MCVYSQVLAKHEHLRYLQSYISLRVLRDCCSELYQCTDRSTDTLLVASQKVDLVVNYDKTYVCAHLSGTHCEKKSYKMWHVIRINHVKICRSSDKLNVLLTVHQSISV
jgi:hypothetical protein